MMSTAEFDARLTHIEEQAQAMQERVDAYQDQEFAKEFDRSGWPHARIAKHLNKRWAGKRKVGQPWVTRRLRFGRFLNSFMPAGINTRSPPAGRPNRGAGFPEG